MKLDQRVTKLENELAEQQHLECVERIRNMTDEELQRRLNELLCKMRPGLTPAQLEESPELRQQLINESWTLLEPARCRRRQAKQHSGGNAANIRTGGTRHDAQATHK